MGSYTSTRFHGHNAGPAGDEHHARFGWTRAPAAVQWMATLDCPLTCGHCLAPADHKGGPEMSLPEVRSLVEQVADAGVDEFLVTGGEPLVREDLPEVIGLLGQRRVRWSLNTAVMPGREVREAVASHPPSFVAVSLDGPAKVHDRFRGKVGAFEESLEAIRFFSSLEGCAVAAGTTVTSRNYGRLSETLGLVAGSGAGSWGIHLLVPEGRAKGRDDLFLSRRQLSGLLKFVAHKRNYFPVNMADEIGYCGDMEPLLRDVPLSCGAGRAQCVVLPDGEVVPCTTLDKSCSAGNVRDLPLMEIWENGFGEQRSWRPEGRCATCEYQRACGGGCWLQRRKGTHCFKDVWHVPGVLKTAAGVAVCLGLVVGATEGLSPNAQTRPPPKPASVRVPWHTIGSASMIEETGGGIEQLILARYGGGLKRAFGRPMPIKKDVRPAKAVETPPAEKDPAFTFFEAFVAGEAPKDFVKLQKSIDVALETKERSLAFSALLWRTLAEACLEGKAPAERSAEEVAALRDSLAALTAATLAWRAEIFNRKLDPYLARNRVHVRYRFEMSKAMRPPPPWLALARDTQEERWGGGFKAAVEKDPLDGFLERHPYGERMELKLALVVPWVSDEVGGRKGTGTETSLAFGIFDILEVPEGGSLKMAVAWGESQYEVSLAGGVYAYPDILRAVHEQNERDLMGEVSNLEYPHRHRLGETNSLLLPAVLAFEQRSKEHVDGKRPSGSRSLDWWLADFWLF